MQDVSYDGTIKGTVAKGFEPVAAEFERNFTQRRDVGAAFAAVHKGRKVVDLWGGMAAPDVPWKEDTLQVIYSGTKGLMASCMLILIERGLIDFDAPVAKYWPEFAANGKADVLIRHVVSHRAGLPGILTPLTLDDIPNYEKLEKLLAAQALSTDPDAYHSYHALTIGWLCGAIIRRVDGRTLGRFFAEEVAGPLKLDAWIGLPESEEHRVGKMELDPDSDWSDDPPENPTHRSIWNNPLLFPTYEDLAWNSRAYHASEIGGAGGIATARAVARYYCCMARGGELDGVRILKPETIAAGLKLRSKFHDPFIDEAMAYSTVFAVQTEDFRFGPAPDAFGHAGAGGSVHGGWPSTGTGFSYVMNQMRMDPEDLRTRHVLTTLHKVIAGA
ncbi:beta-lactamase family protein [Rhizobium sp. TH2]|uniref:serine hydrolase domain-containing protein n=1 Tax=Rhizobium sp. TH2 TaxID=2775403 RepID=UPI0021581ECA|nr:serine hydrolase domain-containing protein [Rhizobium sp. TH2]UVC06654.1 beta-lactamase family protein [Rhizobium sp. TH2]